MTPDEILKALMQPPLVRQPNAIISGPGDIARAHKPDEYITRDELSACVDILDRLCRQVLQETP